MVSPSFQHRASGPLIHSPPAMRTCNTILAAAAGVQVCSNGKLSPLEDRLRDEEQKKVCGGGGQGPHALDLFVSQCSQ